jgi:hypothetical protein
VDNHPVCNNQDTQWVSQAGGGGAINFQTFLAIAGQYSNTTYIIKASQDPYIIGCRQVNFGPYGASGKKSCIIIKGETGNREDVVLAGADPDVDPDFWHSSEYAGKSSCGIGQVFQLFNVEHMVVADLTMRNFAGKMLKVDGRTTWFPNHIRFHNLDLWDCGSQMIKGGSPDTLSSQNGILECSFLHYTDGLFLDSDYETQAIDIHHGGAPEQGTEKRQCGCHSHVELTFGKHSH